MLHRFDVLIACAFNYEAHTTEFSTLGRIPVLKARMNADLHMAEDLKNTDKDNLFIIFGEPDIDLLPQPNGRMRVKVNGVDAFKPQTGEVISHGANDPYSALKTTLKAEGPGSLGDLELRHLAPIRETEERADRGESNQSSGGMR